MPYETNPSGLDLGGGVHIFVYNGDPNQAEFPGRDPHAMSFPGKNESLLTAALSSLCLDPSSGRLFVKTAQPNIWSTNTPWSISGTFPAPAAAHTAPVAPTPTAPTHGATGAGELRPTTGKPVVTQTHGKSAPLPSKHEKRK
jgi:hypothetical protein